jgi:YesN/AraC family two-component response regulator
MVKPIRVLIVDDQPRARQGMRALLGTCPGVEEIREAGNGEQALGLVEESQPDMVLMDVRMPEMNGLEAARIIKARWPHVKVILLSMYGDYASDAPVAGADAFINKAEAPARLLATLAALTE